MSKNPGRPVWLNDEIVDDPVIQALTPREFIDLIDEAVSGKATAENPFFTFITFEDPGEEGDE